MSEYLQQTFTNNFKHLLIKSSFTITLHFLLCECYHNPITKLVSCTIRKNPHHKFIMFYAVRQRFLPCLCRRALVYFCYKYTLYGRRCPRE